MGFLFSKIWREFLGKKDVRILMIGLNDAGKTSILYKLKFDETVITVPKIGFSVETLDYNGLSITVLEVGISDKIRVLWKHYYPNTDGLVLVVDSDDRDRVEVAAEELKKMLAEEELKDCVVLVMANKQDLSGAMSPNEVTDKLGISQFEGRDWLVQGTSAKTGQGLKEGLDWMGRILFEKK